MGVRDILIRNNRISNISQDYREQAAILVTYATGAVIMNNDVSDAPYDGIDVGWGWGANDPGGSPAYRTPTAAITTSPAISPTTRRRSCATRWSSATGSHA